MFEQVSPTANIRRIIVPRPLPQTLSAPAFSSSEATVEEHAEELEQRIVAATTKAVMKELDCWRGSLEREVASAFERLAQVEARSDAVSAKLRSLASAKPFVDITNSSRSASKEDLCEDTRNDGLRPAQIDNGAAAGSTSTPQVSPMKIEASVCSVSLGEEEENDENRVRQTQLGTVDENVNTIKSDLQEIRRKLLLSQEPSGGAGPELAQILQRRRCQVEEPGGELSAQTSPLVSPGRDARHGGQFGTSELQSPVWGTRRVQVGYSSHQSSAATLIRPQPPLSRNSTPALCTRPPAMMPVLTPSRSSDFRFGLGSLAPPNAPASGLAASYGTCSSVQISPPKHSLIDDLRIDCAGEAQASQAAWGGGGWTPRMPPPPTPQVPPGRLAVSPRLLPKSVPVDEVNEDVDDGSISIDPLLPAPVATTLQRQAVSLRMLPRVRATFTSSPTTAPSSLLARSASASVVRISNSRCSL